MAVSIHYILNYSALLVRVFENLSYFLRKVKILIINTIHYLLRKSRSGIDCFRTSRHDEYLIKASVWVSIRLRVLGTGQRISVVLLER